MSSSSRAAFFPNLMLDPDDIAWIKATTNELNNLLQVISESGEVIESLSPKTEETEKYFAILRNGLERAAKVAGSMADRVGGSGAAGLGATPTVETAPLPEVPPLPPAPAGGPLGPPLTGDVRVHNPSGTRELVMIVDDEDFISMLAQRVLCDEGYRVITARDGFQAHVAAAVTPIVTGDAARIAALGHIQRNQRQSPKRSLNFERVRGRFFGRFLGDQAHRRWHLLSSMCSVRS